MKNLLKNRPLIISLAAVALIIGAVVISWVSALHILEHMTIRQVSTTQMAAAMREDHFWYTYRTNTLVFAATVTAVNRQNGRTQLSLKSGDVYGASCEVAAATANFKIGSTYKFIAEPYQAQRQPTGVLLHNCTVI